MAQATLTSTFSDIADAIRTKTGKVATMTPAEMPGEILSISGGGFDYKAWLQAAGISPSGFADLAAVLADEETVRHLMTIHAAVDYLTGFTASDASIQTILNNNYAAKWINLRDYALDTLDGVYGTLMSSIGKYGYGEWAYINNTWQPKGCVPIMTSNSAPYGEASVSSALYTSEPAWHVFDGTTSRWIGNNIGAGATDYAAYKFTNPVCVKKVSFTVAGNCNYQSYQVDASNDGTNWTTLYSKTEQVENGESRTFNITNDNYYLYYRLYGACYANRVGLNNLQFYGRSLTVSVPTMTSNTAPYGECGGTIPLHSTSASTYPYSSLFSNNGAGFVTNRFSAGYIYYKFTSPVVVKRARYVNTANGNNSLKTGAYIASNDGTNWTELITIAGSNVGNAIFDTDLNNDTPYLYYAIRVDTVYANFTMLSLQFYGEEYGQYDWDTDTPRRYLYDHGVELETIATSGTVTKGADALTLSAANAQATATVNLTNYDLLRGVVGQHFSGTTQLIAATTATGNMTAGNAPYNEYLDISNVSASLATGAKMTSAGVCDVAEMWLE